MTSKDRPGSEPDVAYTYDNRSLQLSALHAATGLGITSAWDGFGRQVSSATSLDGARTYAFHYDADGNRTRVAPPDGPWFDYGYDGLGRMTTLRDNQGTILVALGYDASGRRAGAAYAGGAATSYAYDGAGRLSGLSHDFAGTAQDVTFSYLYNPASQIDSRTIGNALYASPAAGPNTAYAANGLNQYTQVGGGAVVHDAKGNLTAEGGRTLGYDSENRLVDTSSTIPYYYDPLGRLAGAGSPLAIHYENYVDGLIAEKLPNSSGINFRHVFGPGSDEPIVWYVGPSTNDRRFLHADERGSIVAVTTESKNLLAINRYDEYGRTQTSGTNFGRFLYTGQRWFGAIDLYYYKNRFYYPNAGGRFLQPDPIGYGGGMNLYAYVGGDPVNFTDPLGLRWKPRCVGDGVSEKCGVLWVEDDPSSNGAALLGSSQGYGIAQGIGDGGSLENAPAPNELACLSPLECARDLKEALLRLQQKPKPPFTGKRAQEFAKAAGFQQGPKLSVGALRQLNARQTMQNIRDAKFTRNDVYDWSMFYSVTYERDRSNLTAFVRTEQLIAVLRVWPGQ